MSTQVNIKMVENIATAVMGASDQVDQGRGDYLKALVGETQGALVKKGATKAEALLALSSIHAQFYEAVLRVAETFVPKGTKDRGILIHARANFARTAVSVLRRFITAGNDVMALKAATVTKAFLQARAGPKGPRKARSSRVMRGLAERRAKAIVETFLELATVDADAAASELRALVDKLKAQLSHLEPTTSAPGRSVPGRIRPSDTQVLAAQARPQ